MADIHFPSNHGSKAMKTYTLTNDFHNTHARVRCEGHSCEPGEITIRPNLRQLRRVARELCGMSDCECGSIRGPQRTDDGLPLVVDVSAWYGE
jgi:hypothetical protein